MTPTLRKMQDSVSKYAEAIARVLQVDVEIVDDTLYRVAGTGRFAGGVGRSMAETGLAYSRVIASGEPCVIDLPGFAEVCRKCRHWQRCEETFEMSTPILMGSSVIGVIGFVCFTTEQREHIIASKDIFFDFLRQMGELIASKAVEMLEYERSKAVGELLEDIVDKVEEGVLLVNGRGEVVRLNAKARTILGLPGNSPAPLTARLTQGTEQLLSYREFDLELAGRTHQVVGEAYPLQLGGVSLVFLFRDPRAMQVEALKLAAAGDRVGLEALIGASGVMRELKSQIVRLARSSSTVLIQGESGTGKELVARALHQESAIADGPFVAVNCGAIPEALLESELFGYVRGAFTGANPKGRIGKFEQASGGLLFLDEIGDMPLHLQVKLLRALEQREIQRLGSTAVTPIKVRVIAASNKNLEQMVAEGAFREDLFYRLNVIPIHIPPLRERPEDIRILSEVFVTRYLERLQKRLLALEDSFRETIEAYPWPGNVRELQNTIEFAVNMMDSPGNLHAGLLPGRIRQGGAGGGDMSFEAMERALIRKALALSESGGRAGKVQAAGKLGISVATLYRKIKKYGL